MLDVKVQSDSAAGRETAKKILDGSSSSSGGGSNSGQSSTGTSGEGNGNNNNSENKDGDNTNENVKVNDPEKNKKLAEIVISENIRETYQLKLKIPRILKGLHTNQFFFIDVSDKFYETNYPELIKKIADEKFARYAGFEKGRFFVDKVSEQGGNNGWMTEVTLNPIPPSLANYSKIQQEAEKALIQAMNDESKYQGTDVSSGGGGGLSGPTGLVDMQGKDCTPTIQIDTTGFNIDDTAKYKIGNSSANYAVDTAHMSGKEAILDVFKRFSYDFYYNNRTCPQKMWNKSGRIRGNCGDIARLVMCVGQVHGMKVGCHFRGDHWYNLIEVDGKTYRFDCCFRSRRGYTSPSYGHEMCNNLVFLGGPWSGDI